MKKEWRSINPAKLIRLLERDKKAVSLEINVVFSPYDIPEAVCGFHDEKNKRYIIQFRYIIDEDLVFRKENGFELGFGKNSNRLYEIRIDIETLEAHNVDLLVEFDKVMKRVPEASHKNFEITREVLKQENVLDWAQAT